MSHCPDVFRQFWTHFRIVSSCMAATCLSQQQERIGVDRGGGRLLHFTRRWLACHAAMANLLDAPEPADVAQVRTILDRRLPEFFSVSARKG